MFSKELYKMEVEALFKRFPSVQNVPFGDAYKPGLDRMMAFDEQLGHPSGAFKTIHIAGTNGKGSVANMLAANLAASGYKTGLYTSPHILDFRERMRIKDGSSTVSMVPEDYVLDFIQRYRPDFERLSLSFFEITTGMAFKWFADCGVDWAVVEVGLGGRLDSTNIITPELSVITSIGLDHCALLGNTLAEIAAEKAGIIKPGVPVVVGHRDPETDPVFVARAADSGSRLVFAASAAGPAGALSILAFLAIRSADDLSAAAEVAPSPALQQKLLTEMDLQGRCQAENLGTVAAALSELGIPLHPDAIAHTAVLMDFHGRWEKLSDEPLVICDIGHNPPALKENFAQLREMLRAGYSDLIIVYAVMADKDLGSILPLMPPEASYIFTTPKTARALPAEEIAVKFERFFAPARPKFSVVPDVAEAVQEALAQIAACPKPIIYIGGSTFAVAEALPVFKK
ncbi:MAG: bifunctional folylpolyglutamate synthase/dihydrofolate synthase [Bacteroidales bacterium]|nr:bifunctional folylpolyglutamate synthase/dihydrofolate synthase [Bacteroidales bacterium]